MPTKIGAGGHQQNYDARGRYVKTSYCEIRPTKRQIFGNKRKNQVEKFLCIAEKKNDPYVKELILLIEKGIPCAIQCVNEMRYDSVHKKMREFDIITRKLIIEVKSGKVKKALKQFIEQQEYAKSVNKKYVVFAPNIANATKTAYNKNNIDIVTTKNDLLRIIKEYEK